MTAIYRFHFGMAIPTIYWLKWNCNRANNRITPKLVNNKRKSCWLDKCDLCIHLFVIYQRTGERERKIKKSLWQWKSGWKQKLRCNAMLCNEIMIRCSWVDLIVVEFFFLCTFSYCFFEFTLLSFVNWCKQWKILDWWFVCNISPKKTHKNGFTAITHMGMQTH